MQGKSQILRMFEGNPRMQALINSLWREIHDDNVLENIVQPSHGFSLGQPLRLNASGNYITARADNLQNARCIGLVSRIVSEDIFWIRRSGILPGNYTPGAEYFLSQDNAGEIFIQTDPEVWEDGVIRQYIGKGDASGNLIIRLESYSDQSLFSYIAYASNSNGADFSLVNSDSLPYIAILITDTYLSNPQASDFAGLWYNRKGIEGSNSGGDILLADAYNPDAIGGILLCSTYNI